MFTPDQRSAANQTAATPASRGLQPVSGGTRREEVADAIRSALLSGELQPGQRLKEVELAVVLNVSRPTLREALHELIHEGALVQEPYKGIRVAQTSPDALLSLAEVRVSLESVAAVRLAQEPEKTGLAALHEAHAAHKRAVASGDAVASDMTHLEFHRTLWMHSGNEMLVRIWPLVAAQIRMAMTVDQATRDDPQRDLTMHERLVQAIESGDVEHIRSEVDHHIRSSTEELVQMMRNNDGSTSEGERS